MCQRDSAAESSKLNPKSSINFHRFDARRDVVQHIFMLGLACGQDRTKT
jgi:hypothetical protein